MKLLPPPPLAGASTRRCSKLCTRSELQRPESDHEEEHTQEGDHDSDEDASNRIKNIVNEDAAEDKTGKSDVDFYNSGADVQTKEQFEKKFDEIIDNKK